MFQGLKKFTFLIFIAFSICGSNLKAQNKVLIIGIDGCRPDALLKAETKNIDKLWKNGAYSFNAKTDEISSSGICWTGMLTGVWHEKHRVVSNEYDNPNIGEYPHFFHRIKEQKPELKTFSVVNWTPIHKILQEKDADYSAEFSNDKMVSKHVAKILKHGDVDVIDVAVTALKHLGIEIKEDWKLDGKVAGF